MSKARKEYGTEGAIYGGSKVQREQAREGVSNTDRARYRRSN